MKKESKRLLKSIFAASLVAALGFGMVPFQPIAQTFDTALVVNAEGAEEETVTAYDGRTIPMSDVIAINGGRYYDNLLYAVFWAKDGDTITLLKDYATAPNNNYMYLYNNTNVTVDLNGHTLTIDGWYWIMQYSTENPGSVKFINGNIEGGCIVPDENAIITIGEGATVTAPEGTFAISGNHNYSMGSVVNIEEGATVKSVDEVTIYWPQDGTLNITGGYLEGPTVVYARTGEVNISGGKLVATGEKNEAGVVANGTNPTGDTIVFQAFSSSYGDAPQVTVTGGDFSSVNGAAAKTYAVSQADQEIKPDDFIQGGTFTSGGKADTSVAEYFADSEDNAMLATGEVISKEEYAENGYSVETDAETGLATAVVNGTFIDDAHHTWYQISNGNLTIFGDGEVADKERAFGSWSATERAKIKTVHFTDNVKVKSLRGWFQNCTNLTQVTGQLPDCEKTNLMFSGCTALTTVETFPNISGTDTGLAVNMFQGCSKLTSINGGRIELTGAGSIAAMFSGCSKLSLDLVINGDIVSVSTSGIAQPFNNAATAQNAKIVVCFGENATENAIAEATGSVEESTGNVQVHDFVKDDVDDGVNVYTCRVCGDEYTTYDVAYNEEVKEYKEGAEVVIPAPEGAESGAWFVNGVRVDTLETAENYTVDEDNTLTIKVCEPVESVEWKEFAGNSMVMSSRKKVGNYIKVNLTAKWALPEGAEVVEAGIARVYAEDCPEDFDAQYIYDNGSKKVSSLKTLNGKYSYALSMNSKSAKKTLCAVSFVTYKIGDVTYTDLSDIAVSAEPAADLA